MLTMFQNCTTWHDHIHTSADIIALLTVSCYKQQENCNKYQYLYTSMCALCLYLNQTQVVKILTIFNVF